MKVFDAVVFDMDGLLLDSERIARSTFLDSCQTFGLDDETELFLSLVGRNSTEGKALLKNGLVGKVSFEDFDRCWDQKYTQKINKYPIPLKEGVVELLDYIKAARVPMAVATSTQSQRAKEHLRKSGILTYFEMIIGGEMVSNGKPSPDIYLKTVNAFTSNPQNCLALEDSENGVIAAHRAGLRVIQIPDLVEPSKELKELNHMIFDSLNDVKAYLSNGSFE